MTLGVLTEKGIWMSVYSPISAFAELRLMMTEHIKEGLKKQ
jgi:hypothetical protein